MSTTLTLLKRHGETHFANVSYGYYTLFVSIAYCLLLVLVRKILPSRYTKAPTWKNKLLKNIRTASPWFHLPFLSVIIFLPFYHHYSILNELSVYIKRIGRIAYVLTILNVLLTLRPHNPIIGYHYLDFIGLHKWLSRFLSALGLLHGVGFLMKWALDSEVSMMDRLFNNRRNFAGFLVFLLLILVLLVSLKPWRKRSYTTFYFIHQISQWSFTFLIPYHARPGVSFPYFAILVCICSWRGISYCYHSKYTTVLERIKEEDSLTYVRFSRDAVRTWIPGSHIRVSKYKKLNPMYWLSPTHPFTLSSTSDEPHLDLIIRENSKPYIDVGEYTIVDVYSTVPQKMLEDSQRVAIVVGGSGISFGLGIFKYLQSRNLEYLKFIWLVRNKSDLHVLRHVNIDSNDLEVFVTRSLPPDTSAVSSAKAYDPPEFDDIEFELDEMNETGGSVSVDPKIPTTIHSGKRLDWNVDLAHFIDIHSLDNTWLVCCGPETLLADGERYAQNNNCNFLREFYDL